MAKYTIFTRPRFCAKAQAFGSDKCSVSVGDLILYESPLVGGGTSTELARVLGLASHALPDGSDPGDDTLIVLQVDEFMSFAYERYVKLGEVTRVREPSKSVFAQWFLAGPVPEPEVAIAAVKYGCMNDRYLDERLQDGELRATFRHADKRCPSCDGFVRRCKTGDPDCYHCESCSWSGLLEAA